MKLSSITIHGMHNVDSKTYNLQNTNYFYGPNGVGKSTVLQAIQLAILGYIPGTDKNKTAIFAHSNGNFMAVTAVFDSGEQITRSWEKTSKDIVASVKIIPVGFDIQAALSGIELPIFDFSAFIGLTANKLKDWFINFLPESDTGINIMDKLNPALIINGYTDSDLTEAVAEMTAGSGSWLDKIRSLNEWCKSEMSTNKTEMTRIQSTIQSLIYHEDCDMTVSADAIKEDIRQLDLQRQNISGKLRVLASNVDAYNKMDEIRQKYHGLNDESYMSYLRNKRDEYSAMMTELNAKITAISDRIRELKYATSESSKIINQDGICPYTEAKCESIQGLMMNLTDEYQKNLQEINTLTAEQNSYQIQLRDISGEYSKYSTELANLENASDRYNTLQQTYDSNILSDDESFDSAAKRMAAELADLTSKVEAQQDRLAKVEANNRYNSLVDTLTADKFKLEQRIAVLKSWEKLTGVNGMQTEIMAAPFTAFSAKISEYLTGFFGTKTKAMFVIGEKANSFSFGVVRDSGYISFDLLSSGEKCLYTLALMICIIENSDSPIKMILADDILDHLDSDRIEACFATLYTSNVQSVLAGVKACQYADRAELTVNVR